MGTVRVHRPWDDSFKFDKEPGRGPRITEQAGYIPVDVQVKNMMLAGQRLGEYRKEAYDFEPGVDVPDDVDVDPTRSPFLTWQTGRRKGFVLVQGWLIRKKPQPKKGSSLTFRGRKIFQKRKRKAHNGFIRRTGESC